MQLIVYFINSFKVNEKEIYFSPQYSLNLFTAHQEQKKRGFYLRTTLYYKTLGYRHKNRAMVTGLTAQLEVILKNQTTIHNKHQHCCPR